MNNFYHVHMRNGKQPRLQLNLKLHPNLHLTLLLAFKPGLKPTPPDDPTPLTLHPHPRRLVE